MIFIFIFCLFIIGGFTHYQFECQLFVGMLGLSLFIAHRLYEKVHWLVALGFLYFSTISTYYLCFPWRMLGAIDPVLMTGMRDFLGEALIYLTLFGFAATIMTKKLSQKIELLIIGLSVVDMTMMGVRYFTIGVPYFLFNNPAIDSSFIVCTIPIILNKIKNIKIHFLYIPIVAAVLIPAKTSSGIFGLGLSISAYYWAQEKFRFKQLIVGVILAALFGGIGILSQGKDIYMTSGRAGILKMAFGFWNDPTTYLKEAKISHIFGTGLGTYQILGPGLQATMAYKNGEDHVTDGFFWLHDDWAQVLFEGGLIGLGLTLCIFTLCFLSALSKPHIFASLSTFGAIAFIQMPVRWSAFSILGAWLMIQSLGAAKEETS